MNGRVKKNIKSAGFLAGAGLAVMLLALACTQASQTSTGAPSAGNAVVRVITSEWHMKPSIASVMAGSVTFEMVNKGAIDHEVVILKTDLSPNALIKASGTSKIDEGASGENLGEVEAAAGATQSGTFKLAPGHYVLICNVPAHYQAGMFADFEVR